jgi:predicted CopG family antitoxin
MESTITIKKEALKDLVRVKEEFDSIVESLELMSNKEFMNSYEEAKIQVEKREFDDWNEL